MYRKLSNWRRRISRTEIPSQFIGGHRSHMGPSMGIDEVFLTMIPSIGYRWTIDDPSMGIEIFDHKNSFDLAMFKISTKLSPFKFFSLFIFVWEFEDAQIFYSEMKLYIVIHNIYLCEKLDYVDFPRKKHQFF